MTSEELFLKLGNGDRAALARAITLVESGRAADKQQARELLRLAGTLHPDTFRIGITGIPGVGKSTLIDALGMELIRRGHKVAVLAVDPSSQRSGGSILGDKTRMQGLANESNAFIRPTATGGTLGGVAKCTREAILLCEAAGYDRILIETVGVGQSELEVDHMVDINVLLMIAGAGDELQGIKRGIMEAADVVVFTKADGEAETRAIAAARDLKQALALLPERASGRRTEVLLASATTGKGIAALCDHLHKLKEEDQHSNRTRPRREKQALYWFDRALTSSLMDRFHADAQVRRQRSVLEELIRSGTRTPTEAAEELIRHFLREHDDQAGTSPDAGPKVEGGKD